MLHRDAKLLLFFHEPGTGGDCVTNMLDGAKLGNKRLRSTHQYLLDHHGRSQPSPRDEYLALFDDPRVLTEHSDMGKDLGVVQRLIDHADRKDQILVLRMCEQWDTVERLQNTIPDTFTITMQVPHNMHQCVLKNRHKVVRTYEPIDDRNFETLKKIDGRKALGLLYTKMLASGEGVTFDDKLTDHSKIDYPCSIEQLHTARFTEVLAKDLGIELGDHARIFHSQWLDRQSPLYRFNLSDNPHFRECFGFNPLSPINNGSFDLDLLDRAYLLHYQKTKNWPPVRGIRDTDGVVKYFHDRGSMPDPDVR